MAIHYDPKAKRFRDDSGRLVSRDRAMRSSVARREFEAAQKKAKPKPKAKPAPVKPKAKPAPVKAKPKPKAKPAPVKVKPKPKAKPKPPAKVPQEKPKAKPRERPSPRDFPPWEQEGIVREYPEPDEWFPEVDFYGYDDLEDDWGDFDDEDTDS